MLTVYSSAERLLPTHPGKKTLFKSSQVKSSQFIFLRIVQHEIFTNYDATYNNYRKYAMVVMNVQTQDRRHKV